VTDQRVHGDYTDVLRSGGADTRVHGLYVNVLRSVASGVQQQQVHGAYVMVLRPSASGGGGTPGWSSGGRGLPILPDVRR